MINQTCLSKANFQKMEEKLLEQVMTTSKSLIETFKFKILYGLNVSSKLNKKTVEGLKEFRAKHRDKNLDNEETYQKYLNLY